jgi:hypothetical protein
MLHEIQARVLHILKAIERGKSLSGLYYMAVLNAFEAAHYGDPMAAREHLEDAKRLCPNLDIAEFGSQYEPESDMERARRA